jgi:hypothetical protein
MHRCDQYRKRRVSSLFSPGCFETVGGRSAILLTGLCASIWSAFSCAMSRTSPCIASLASESVRKVMDAFCLGWLVCTFVLPCLKQVFKVNPKTMCFNSIIARWAERHSFLFTLKRPKKGKLLYL